MKSLCYAAIALFACAIPCYADRASHYSAWHEVKEMLAEDFEALNRGEKTLGEVGERTLILADAVGSDEKKRILLNGAQRIFLRCGDTNRAETAQSRLAMWMSPFATLGNVAILRLGKYGEIPFVKCPTGTVDLAVHWRNGSTVRVAITNSYWIMKYPLTHRQSMLYPPFAGMNNNPEDARYEKYVCPNRNQTDEIASCFTQYFKDALPEGYEVRLPTLVEWEHAFHAGTNDRQSPFYDLLRIHINDDVHRAVCHDYDKDAPRRKQLTNNWGIGDWCGQEKVIDIADPSKLVKSSSDGEDSFQVQALPPFETTINPCFRSTASNRVSIIRMPFWARWRATRIGKGDDWCPVRFVIAPKIR